MTRRRAVYCWNWAAWKGRPQTAFRSAASSAGERKPGSYENPAGSSAASPAKRSGVLALAMLPSLSRYAAHRLGRGLALLQRKIPQGKDADQALVAADHRKPPDLDVRHVFRHVVEFLVLEAVFHVRAHHVAHGRVGPLALRDRADGNVAVGDHADQAV